jgi:hypothetical protein
VGVLNEGTKFEIINSVDEILEGVLDNDKSINGTKIFSFGLC